MYKSKKFCSHMAYAFFFLDSLQFLLSFVNVVGILLVVMNMIFPFSLPTKDLFILCYSEKIFCLHNQH